MSVGGSSHREIEAAILNEQPPVGDLPGDPFVFFRNISAHEDRVIVGWRYEIHTQQDGTHHEQTFVLGFAPHPDPNEGAGQLDIESTSNWFDWARLQIRGDSGGVFAEVDRPAEDTYRQVMLPPDTGIQWPAREDLTVSMDIGGTDSDADYTVVIWYYEP